MTAAGGGAGGGALPARGLKWRLPEIVHWGDRGRDRALPGAAGRRRDGGRRCGCRTVMKASRGDGTRLEGDG